MSDVYVALLRTQPPADATGDARSDAPTDDDASREGATAATRWTVLDHAIGPSDVAWLTWPQRYAAPRQLFGF